MSKVIPIKEDIHAPENKKFMKDACDDWEDRVRWCGLCQNEVKVKDGVCSECGSAEALIIPGFDI